MMKYFALVLVFIWALAIDAGALGEDKPKESIFVGQYGEVLHVPLTWGVEAEMHDSIEVIRFHDRTMESHTVARSTIPDTVMVYSHPPESKEYILENFNTKGLMQLLVIPKSSPGYKSLTALRQAKVQELVSSRVEYSTDVMAGFPKDSFSVDITKPYVLRQIYTQSDKHFFILSSCVGSRNRIAAHPNWIVDALESYLSQFKVKPNLDPLGMFRHPVLYVIWAGINGLWLILSFLPGRRRWTRYLRQIGRALLVFPNALAVFGWSVVYIGATFDIARWCNAFSSSFCVALLMPGVCFIGSAVFRGIRLRRVFWGTFGISAFLAWMSYGDVITRFHSPDALSSDIFPMAVISHMFFGLIYGICFGLTHVSAADDQDSSTSEKDPAIFALLICLIPFLPVRTYSQTRMVMVEGTPIKVGPMGDGPSTVAWAYLSKYGLDSPEAVRRNAENQVRAGGGNPRFPPRGGSRGFCH
jgi:hypothetical protein